MRSTDLVRLLVDVAEDQPKIAGLLRQAARTILEHAPKDQTPNLCAQCGGEIEQLARGRPRKFCIRCSPRKKPGK